MKFERLEWTDDLPGVLMPLLREHYHEIARYKDIPLNPDFEMYRNAAMMGLLRVFAMLESESIVGYAVFFVKHAPHYKDSLQALQDILYIDPRMRKGTNGIRFIKWCDDQLRAEGVQMVMHHVKVYKDFGKILERMGYEAVDTIYVKRLDYGNKHSGVYCTDRGSRSSGSHRVSEAVAETADAIV